MSVRMSSPTELAAMRDRLRVFAQYDGDVHESAEVIVVGSGPAGSVVAYELAAAGRDPITGEGIRARIAEAKTRVESAS